MARVVPSNTLCGWLGAPLRRSHEMGEHNTTYTSPMVELAPSITQLCCPSTLPPLLEPNRVCTSACIRTPKQTLTRTHTQRNMHKLQRKHGFCGHVATPTLQAKRRLRCLRKRPRLSLTHGRALCPIERGQRMSSRRDESTLGKHPRSHLPPRPPPPRHRSLSLR